MFGTNWLHPLWRRPPWILSRRDWTNGWMWNYKPSASYPLLLQVTTTQPSYLHSRNHHCSASSQNTLLLWSHLLVHLHHHLCTNCYSFFQYASFVSGINSRLLSVNHALISPNMTYSVYEGISPIGTIDSPLSPSITSSLFHSRLKTSIFWKSFPQ